MASAPSKFICIREAPAPWNSGTIERKFEAYGPVKEVTIEPNANSKTNSVIVEFEDEEDAIEAVNDPDNRDLSISFYRPERSIGPLVLITQEDDSHLRHESPSAVPIYCANSDCTNQVVVEGMGNEDFMSIKKKIYCTNECYLQFVDMKGRVDIYDKFLASLGRSGTGMLENPKKFSNLTIKVDFDSGMLTRTVTLRKESDHENEGNQ